MHYDFLCRHSQPRAIVGSFPVLRHFPCQGKNDTSVYADPQERRQNFQEDWEEADETINVGFARTNGGQ
jgi:hypothetical protein